MFSLKSTNFYDVAKPLYIFSKFIGVTSFTFKKEKDFRAYVTKMDLIWLILMSVNNVAGTVQFIIHEDQAWGIMTSSEAFRQSINLVIIGFQMIPTVSIWWFFLWTFADIFNRFLEINNELDEMRVKLDFKESKKVILGLRTFDCVCCN